MKMFILRSRKGLGVCTTPSVKIAVGRRKKTVGISNLGGFHITESTDAGPNKSELRMIPTDPLRPNGLRDNRYHWSLGTDRSAAGVKQILRRVRDQDFEPIEEIDLKIEDLQGQIRALRISREAAVNACWSKAHVVRLSEVELSGTDAKEVSAEGSGS